MAENKNFDWGSTNSKLIGGTEYINDRRVHHKGTYTIKPFGIVPIMLHETDAVFCIAKSFGLHAITIKAEDKDLYSYMKIMEMLAEAPRMEIGDTIDCPKGCGLALYNSIGLQSTVEFQEYYPD